MSNTPQTVDKKLWRWLLMPPASLIGSALSAYIWAHIDTGFLSSFSLIRTISGSAVFGGMYTYIAFSVSPHSKTTATTAMVTIFAMTHIFSFSALYLMKIAIFDTSTVSSIVSSLTSVVTLVAMHHNQKMQSIS
jgi:hypothetical protein